VFARVAKPLANGIALAGRSDYPFSAPTAQCIGLLLTSGIFLCLSSRHSEFYERKTFEDKSTLAKSFVVGSLAGIGDVCEMLANQYAGVALTAVLLVASRVVITAAMSRVVLKKEIPEIQILCLLIVVISIMAFGIATSQDKSVSLDRLLVGLGFVFVSASLLSSQSIVKELVAGTPAKAADGSSRPTTNFHENMVCLFAGAGFSSFLLAMYELRCNMIHFFNGWELRTIPIPMSICLMAVLSSLFTKYFGALTTVLIAVLSVVLVFFSSVVLFGQPMPPLVLVLLMLVAVSVMVAARAGFISKDFSARISQQADVLQMAKGSLEKRMQVLPSQLSESWLSQSGRNSGTSMCSLDSLEEPLLKAQGALA
jgi:drug/metabolite transporter (DMT)-like permease